MGMNMLSKATEFAIQRMLDVFPDMEVTLLDSLLPEKQNNPTIKSWMSV